MTTARLELKGLLVEHQDPGRARIVNARVTRRLDF
jgi:hypothetical protein